MICPVLVVVYRLLSGERDLEREHDLLGLSRSPPTQAAPVTQHFERLDVTKKKWLTGVSRVALNPRVRKY